MNILITNDDGPEAYGLNMLRAAVIRRWKTAHVVTLTPHKSMTGQGMAISPGMDLKGAPREQVETDWWTVRLRPADIVYLAFYHTELFLKGKGTWDLVCCGVNHGRNVGFDILHSGTVGQAIIASTFFNCAAFSFSQDLAAGTEPINYTDDKPNFEKAYRYLLDFLNTTAPIEGECWNINFPVGPPKGYETCPVAHWSSWRPETTHVPRARRASDDITKLLEGYITISDVNLQINPTLSY